MAKVPNIFFIMCDQLRWDYFSCYGHPNLKKPHIDGIAAHDIHFQLPGGEASRSPLQ